MFILNKGKTKFQWLPVTASTVLSKGALVAFSSGKLIAATSTTAPSDIVGVIRHAIAATDSDYATERLVEVEVPVEKNTVWEAAVTSGLVAADIGLYQDLTDSVTVNRGASTYDVVQCIKVISTTKGLFFLNIGADARAKA
ncbi:hypothetical protein M0R04_10210 [Candidatus Dojkabacteria bacterium]|jgi:hypothetical protein|nr:hypothetical protein [Candidatus Dojkabacteria bacterium]